jgi:hypothetical protein
MMNSLMICAGLGSSGFPGPAFTAIDMLAAAEGPETALKHSEIVLKIDRCPPRSRLARAIGGVHCCCTA